MCFRPVDVVYEHRVDLEPVESVKVVDRFHSVRAYGEPFSLKLKDFFIGHRSNVWMYGGRTDLLTVSHKVIKGLGQENRTLNVWR
jgi:hypothetical protein